MCCTLIKEYYVKIYEINISHTNKLNFLYTLLYRFESIYKHFINLYFSYAIFFTTYYHFFSRSLPFYLPDHYIILEYHLNRLMHNTPEQSKFKSNRIVNLDYSPTTSFHTAPFYDSHSNIFNLKIGDCIQKSPEITAKLNKDNLETIASSCADRFCTSAVRESEECNLRNMIIYHMHLLREVYNFYASLGINDKLPLNSEPVLVRLFLWQLFRDCGLSKRGTNLKICY